MENSKNRSIVWKIISLILAIALIAVSTCFAIHLKGEKAEEAEKPQETPVLTLWNDRAVAKSELINYIEAITDEGSADYIPPEDRIAVFDLDGPLVCETDPV